ncbi:Transposase [compost metagenome]
MAKNRKYGTAFKLQVIKDNLKGFSINSLSRKWDISTSVIRKWIDHHRSNGEIGLSGKLRTYYTKEFKLTVVRAYKNKGLSLRDCCLHFNIRDQSSISSWIAKYEQQGLDGLNEQKKGRPPIMKRDRPISKEAKPLTRLEALERENLHLKAEIDFLKKLDALTLLKQTQQRKKR